MPRVVSLWFPTLPTDRLRASRAAPPDGPLVAAVADHGRRIVAAASVEALAAGARGGQPLAEARVRVPGLIVREADPRADAALLRRLSFHAARCWTPLVAVDGDDGLLLDIGASAHLAGGEARLLARIAAVARRAGVEHRAAVADRVGSAWALARHAPAIVAPGGDARAVAGLPPAALRLADATVDALLRLGFDSVGAILAAPRAPMIRRFGAAFARRLDQIAGAAAEPIAPLVPPEAPRAGRTMVEPIGTADAIAAVIDDLAADLCRRLEARGQGVVRAVLVCRRVDAAEQAVAIGLARAARAPAHLAELLRRRIEAIDPGFGIEAMTLVGLRVQALPPEQVAHPLPHARPRPPGDVVVAFPGRRLPDAAATAEPDLAVLVDRLATRFGGGALHRAAPAESDAPARSVVRLDPLAPPSARGWRDDWPRPPRLLRRAEPAQVTALLPDHGPKAFTWRGTRHTVVATDGPERLYGEWWRGGAPFRTRDYFQVEVEGGGRYWLFRRGDGRDPDTGPGDWFVHGAFG